MTINEILLQRGFSQQDIDTGFANYSDNDWCIKTITKEQVATAKTPNHLIGLFKKDSIDYNIMSSWGDDRRFSTFARDNAPLAIAPSQLDPYIARFCKAINEIGIRTCMCCDGWHSRYKYSSDMQLYMEDHYSVIWFWLITEYIFGEKWSGNKRYKGTWENIWEPFDKEFYGLGYIHVNLLRCKYRINNNSETKAVFEKNNNYAVFIENHKEEFLQLKKHITDTIEEQIKNNIIEPIDFMGFLEARRCMLEVFAPAAEPLIKAFEREYPSVLKENENLYRRNFSR